MASQIENSTAGRETWMPEDRRRYIARREFLRGKQDGRLGFSPGGTSPTYIEGYTLGRKIFFGLVRE